MADTLGTVTTTTDALAGKDTQALMGELFEKLEPGVFDDDQDPDTQEDGATEETEDGTEGAEATDDTPETEETEDDQQEEATEDDEGTDPDPDTQLHSVKIDGKTEQVTLEELKKGYSRTKVFTQKTQEVAEQRKALAAQEQAVTSERETLKALIESLKGQIEAGEGKEPDWEALAAEDREEYLYQRQVWQDRREKRERLEKVKAELDRRNAEQFAKAHTERLAQEQEKLLEKRPAWKDAAARSKRFGEIKDYLLSQGFSESDAAGITDHRLMLVLDDATRFRALMAKKPDLEGVKPGGVPKTVKASPKPMVPGRGAATTKVAEQRRVAVERSKQTGTVRDAAKAMALIPGLLD